MAAPQTASSGNDRRALRASLRRQRDQIVETYLDWREEAAARLYADVTADGERVLNSC
jgi:hypothetical protein